MTVGDVNWAALSPRSRVILNEVATLNAAGLTYREIGERLGVSPSRVAGWMRRLRTELRELASEEAR